MYRTEPIYPVYDPYVGHGLSRCESCRDHVEQDWEFCAYCGTELEAPDTVSSYLCCNTPMQHERKPRMAGQDPSGLAGLVVRTTPATDECLTCGAIWFDLPDDGTPVHREPDRWNYQTTGRRFAAHLQQYFGLTLPASISTTQNR